MVRVLENAVIGRDPDESEAFWSDAWRRINFIGFTGVSIMGISALDGALWDLRGKRRGLSIARLIGRCHDRVPAYASGGGWLTQSIDELTREAQDFAAQGFGAIKLRLAGRAAVDLPRIAAVRDAIGPEIGLMVDANQGLSVKAAIRLAQEMQPYDIAWFEEPVPAHDLAASAAVAAGIGMPLASGENEYTRHGFARMIAARAADILMPDLQRVGGPSEFLKVAALAATHGLPISSHLFPEQSVQLLGAIAGVHSLEHLGWFAPLYRETLDLADGHVTVPDRPGWGFTFDPKALQHFGI